LNGFKLRWDTAFQSFEEDPKTGHLTTTLFDRVTNQTFKVRSKYLFGADGARSKVLDQLQLPLIQFPGQGFAVNIHFEADMSQIIEPRKGNLHWLFTPDKEYPEHATLASMRMVKPWKEWMIVVFPAPGSPRVARPAADYVKRLGEFIGDDSIETKILGINTWLINEITAEQYSKGNVFCLGDSVHRHPPNHGLGSNTCIQDAHNLAWKIAYVEKGWAGRELLDSYNDERQPVGQQVVTLTNASLRNHMKIWGILGTYEPTPAARMEKIHELKANTPKGRQRREDLQAALKRIHREEQGLGIEMNQHYTSNAVYKSDQGPMPTFETDDLEYYHATTYPGARVPHVWLYPGAVPCKKVSTYDLAGNAKFALFTGIGGEGWKTAAKQVSDELGVPIVAYSIGYGQDYKDIYLDWANIRGADEDGCVLVRPDYFVAWRSNNWEEGSSASKLKDVVKSVLSRS
jgi:2-polyprenyl-6-methoxyphenol hydroxylase-like FAD-dependent oxidoreductase